MPRLPKIGSDANAWGTILNEYLSVEHNADGSLKESGSLAKKQPLSGDLTAISGLKPIANDLLQYKDGAWKSTTPAQVKADLTLNNVDNTADIEKPISHAAQSALDAKPSGSPYIRNYNKKNYSYICTTASGWADFYGNGTAVHDTVDYILGTGSIKLVTSADATNPCGMRKMLGATVDWRNKTLKVWVKADDWSKLSAAVVVVSTSGTFASSFRISLAPFMTNPTNYNGKWVELVLPQDKAVTQSGTPDWSTVNGVMVKAYGQTGVSGTIHFNEIAVIDNPGRSMISITFDDGHVSQFTNAKPILDAYGYKATNFTIPSYIGNANYMSQEQTDILAGIGWDISGHYETDLTTLSSDQLHSAMKLVRTYLNNHGYKGGDLMAYPNGAENPSVIEVVRRYFSGAATIVDTAQSFNYVDRMRISRRTIHRTDTLATIQGWVDTAIANNEWLILCFHKIVESPSAAIDYAISDFATLIGYINSKNVTVLPMSEALSKTSEGGGSHKDLSDIGTNTHAQIDSALSALSAPTARWIRPYHCGFAAADATPVSGRVMLYLMEVEKACTIDALVFVNGSVASGNATVGLYGPVAFTSDTCSGAALVGQSASTAITAVNAPQTVALSSPASVGAGKYYIAVEHDNITDRYMRVTSQTQIVGWVQYFDQAYGVLPTTCPAVTETGSNAHGVTARCGA